MKRLVFFIAAIGLLFPGTSDARDYGLGIRGGTQGLGVDGAVEIRDWVSARGALYGGSPSFDFEEGGNDYDGEITLGGAGVLADFFPKRGKFRLTAGLFANRNEIEFDTTPIVPIEIGDDTYDPAEVGQLVGRVEFDSVAPYVGIGWGNVAKGRGRLGFVFDVGFLVQGTPEVSLARSSMIANPALDADIQREENEIENEIDGMEFWPVISFGLAIRL